MTTERFDTVILGAGAAGMMCAIHAAARGGRVLILDHAKAPGEKIRISGGGRCNFTNIGTSARNFLSGNPHFAKSALSRYTQHDFVALVEKHGIAYHEKTLGQLFCDHSAKDIIAMLTGEMARAGCELRLGTTLESLERSTDGFALRLGGDGAGAIRCRHFVVASGGKSIPKMGASGLGYQIAGQFGLALTETRPALVPLTFGEEVLAGFRELAGLAAEARVSCGKTAFDEALLFTHRGLSGPAILQISSYWREKQPISIVFLPKQDVFAMLRASRQENGRRSIANALGEILPKRLASYLAENHGWAGPIGDASDKKLAAVASTIQGWEVMPIGSEGYRTAEVTLGGVDTAGLNSRTMEAKAVDGLYFIGEVVDVTGWLGGYNFQWAWSSGWAAGTAIAERSG
ncbi:NAD(P)/FAD-dependent oxidoreductase [Bosea sp. (in: a-proteobacteria)]|uniref:NAD(P)/FAD-dependent oxidoreductase n=1 Tax=Bosea sp. (in: a-proteobacteria) TaxID=1871050 RepID=UPI001AC1AF66|nr:NAD(P)/FAD-dependent oxidoreductase [Bosea sp. (in: a-proteobacteria)]MBN9437131.1 NAD(P)/FAD-dependent oxidoreductase [Bosea sp. (in: a-proteobacteria)]